jgi:hypothetical protein
LFLVAAKIVFLKGIVPLQPQQCPLRGQRGGEKSSFVNSIVLFKLTFISERNGRKELKGISSFVFLREAGDPPLSALSVPKGTPGTKFEDL